MDTIFAQLAELAKSLVAIGVRPVICGGLGVYIRFYDKSRSSEQMLRTTNDIDLMLVESDIMVQAKRKAIADVIIDELRYAVREDGRCFRFKKAIDQELDILTPPAKGIKVEGGRTKLVKSRLHGRITEEAEFIEMGLKKISIPNLSKTEQAKEIFVYVPSSTNSLILKLFAFDDRIKKGDVGRAQAHAWDIYITMQLSTREDFEEGQSLLAKHIDSPILRRAQSIVFESFSTLDQQGWRQLLQTADFHPELDSAHKKVKLDVAMRRIVRWFTE
ncbi:MAG: hypothetical protein DRP56_00275 [Planctomycetota bacterium]|nr:MAG: hypothetical protein DRP56_00275 [Planctomycetota bacterium]